MTFEQQTIPAADLSVPMRSAAPRPEVRTVSAGSLLSPGEEGIFFCIDNYTMMFYDRSMIDVLAWLHIDYLIDDFMNVVFTQLCEQKEDVVFYFEGIRIQANKCNFYGYGDGDRSVFEKVMPRIRLEISGRGLDYLRDLKLYCVDEYLRDWDNVPKPARMTRCDFAFDFVNTYSDIIDVITEHCWQSHTPTRRLMMYKSQAMKYDIKKGSEHTIYIGSKGSKKLLRIYDKKLERMDRFGNYKENPYSNPDSWIRFELQARDDIAQNLCFNEKKEPLAVLKTIYESFCFAEKIGIGHDVSCYRPCKWWQEFFDWQHIASIVQNLYFDGFYMKDPKARAQDNAEKHLPGFLRDLTACDSNYIELLLSNYLEYLNSGTDYSNRTLTSLHSYLQPLGIDLYFSKQGYFIEDVAGRTFVCFRFPSFISDKVFYPPQYYDHVERLQTIITQDTSESQDLDKLTGMDRFYAMQKRVQAAFSSTKGGDQE